MVLPAPNPIKLTSHSRARVRKYDYQPNERYPKLLCLKFLTCDDA